MQEWKSVVRESEMYVKILRLKSKKHRYQYGNVSKWGVRFSRESSNFETKNGHLILRHAHIKKIKLDKYKHMKIWCLYNIYKYITI